jgi:hypothetical protein
MCVSVFVCVCECVCVSVFVCVCVCVMLYESGGFRTAAIILILHDWHSSEMQA